MRVLHGIDLAKAIRGMFEDEGLRCAVAFWGPEMAALAQSRRAVVVLDMSMNCTSRGALEAFGVKKGMARSVGQRVNVLDGLHAKIYLGRETAIVGSANASGNALGRKGGMPALHETGVWIDKATEPEAFHQVEDVWLRYLSASRPIRPDDLDRACLLPVSRSARDQAPSAGDRRGSVFAAVRHSPEVFACTTFMFADNPVEGDQIRRAEDAYEIEQGARPREDGRSYVCSVNDDLETDNRIRRASQLLFWWFGHSPGLYAYHDVVRIEHDGGASYFARIHWSTVKKALRIPLLTKGEAWRFDMTEAKRLMAREGGRTGTRFVSMTNAELFDAIQTKPGG